MLHLRYHFRLHHPDRLVGLRALEWDFKFELIISTNFEVRRFSESTRTWTSMQSSLKNFKLSTISKFDEINFFTNSISTNSKIEVSKSINFWRSSTFDLFYFSSVKLKTHVHLKLAAFINGPITIGRYWWNSSPRIWQIRAQAEII